MILVALRKESVDRNGFGAKLVHSFLSSLSARRAWIEISPVSAPYEAPTVALRKESVDRNKIIQINKILNFRRSPQGERG